MRYLTLAEALVIAEAVTSLDTATIAKASRLELLDSALHAPQASFGGEDFYPTLLDKAAVLVVRIARNHALPDGNKRLAWQAPTMFLALNDLAPRGPHRRCRGPHAGRRCRRSRRGRRQDLVGGTPPPGHGRLGHRTSRPSRLQSSGSDTASTSQSRSASVPK